MGILDAPPIGADISPLLPASSVAQLLQQPQQQPQAPSSPFVWGQGGQMLMPDQIARRQQMATAMQQAGMDYSPVASWTQGLARAAQGLVGGMEQRKLDKQEAAQASYAQQIMQSLSGGMPGAPTGGVPTPGAAPGGAPGVAPGVPVAGGAAPGVPSGRPNLMAIIANPWLPESVKDMAKFQAQKDYEQQEKQPEVVQLERIANDPTQTPEIRAAAATHVRVMNDPTVQMPLPGNRGMYVGPRSGYETAVGAAGASTVAGAAPPATLPHDFFDNGGGPAPSAPAGFPDPMKAPGHMTSGRRTVEGNALVGGVPTSHHLDGDAADYTGASLAQLQAYFGPAAHYLDEGNHVHVTLPGYHRMPYLGGVGSTGAR